MVLCHWSAIQTSRCVSSIYPPLVSSGHVLPREDSSRLGSAGEGGRPHGNRRPVVQAALGKHPQLYRPIRVKTDRAQTSFPFTQNTRFGLSGPCLHWLLVPDVRLSCIWARL
ncbi:hypothetical protein J1605_009925 [Eschrichtius robustus]|uniref:Uncharacterized protein n=1 Tax=Eschrichtius robustus TaxID=9764 RepID=A0AB34GQN0_ESCRO|nr:hypothetical protein J1605_009925 [Eschrichtius robustus]